MRWNLVRMVACTWLTQAASADTAQTASSNPAGMSRLDRPSTTLRVLLANGLGDFEIDENLTTTLGGNPDSEFSPVVVPLAYHARPIGEGWYAGIPLTVPTGFGADLGGSWAGRCSRNGDCWICGSGSGTCCRSA